MLGVGQTRKMRDQWGTGQRRHKKGSPVIMAAQFQLVSAVAPQAVLDSSCILLPAMEAAVQDQGGPREGMCS